MLKFQVTWFLVFSTFYKTVHKQNLQYMIVCNDYSCRELSSYLSVHRMTRRQRTMLTSHKVDWSLWLLFRDVDVLKCVNLGACSSGTLKIEMKGKKRFLPQLVCIRAWAPCCRLKPWQQLDKCRGWFKVRVWNKMLYLPSNSLWYRDTWASRKTGL